MRLLKPSTLGIVAILFGVACFDTKTGAARSKVRTELQMVNNYGSAIDFKLDALQNLVLEKDFIANCTGHMCNDLPPGSFAYEATALPWAVKITGRIVASPANSLVTLAEFNHWGGGGDRVWATIAGTVKGLRDPAKSWIRVRAIFGDDAVDQRIQADGSFKLADCPMGKNAVTIVEDNKLVYADFITTYGGDKPLEIIIKTRVD